MWRFFRVFCRNLLELVGNFPFLVISERAFSGVKIVENFFRVWKTGKDW